jgi:hypothetical protein
MFKNFKWQSLLAVLIIQLSVFSPTAEAQTSSLRKSIATVMLAGVGGAILGLSTLSFYGQPSDHVNNISTGFLLGLAGGTGYVIYQQASDPVASSYEVRRENRIKSFKSVSANYPVFTYRFYF